jgi:hypothetical protein
VRLRHLLVACAMAASLAWTAALPAGAVDTMSPGAPQGNVTPTLQPAKGVAVVAQSAAVDGRVALVVHNATTQPVRIDRVTVVATRTDGGAATRARSVKVYPQVVGPDQLALGAVTFRTKELTPDAKFTAKVRSTPVSTARAARVLSVGNLALSAPGTGSVAQTLRATLTNTTKSWTARLPETAVMCFGEAGTPTTFTTARASARGVAPGKTVSASVPLATLCPTYLVAARAS